MKIFAILLLVFATEFIFGDEDGKSLSGDKTRVEFEERGLPSRLRRFGPPKQRLISKSIENVEASTTEKIEKVFNAITKGDKDITIKDLTKQIVESKITTYGKEEINENIKQFDDGDNEIDFKEFQNWILFDEDEQFVTDDDLQDFLNKLDGSNLA